MCNEIHRFTRWHKSRCECLAHIVCAAIDSRSVRLDDLASKIPGNAKFVSKTRRLQYFFHDFELDTWSSGILREQDKNVVCINPVIYAEVSIRFARIEELEKALPDLFERLPVPYEAAFLAGKCFLDYRKRGGKRESTLQDFFIGAHASVSRMTLITRDASRYRTYFPKLHVIAPA